MAKYLWAWGGWSRKISSPDLTCHRTIPGAWLTHTQSLQGALSHDTQAVPANGETAQATGSMGQADRRVHRHSESHTQEEASHNLPLDPDFPGPQRAMVATEARRGRTCRKGTMPSRAMACNRRGAPVRLCRPAPQVEKKEPMTMTQGDGQASMPMTRFPCKASPNLWGQGRQSAQLPGNKLSPGGEFQVGSAPQ